MDIKVKFVCILLNFNSSFLNTLTEEELAIYISRLYRLDITAVKKESLKKLYLILEIRNLLFWKPRRYCLVDLADKDTRDILLIKHNFLNQRLNIKDSKPNLLKRFSEGVPFIAPVIAMSALYWIDSRFLWNDSLNSRS